MKSGKSHPPNLPLRFFRWYCHQDYQEDIEGDLLEKFEKRALQQGLKVAEVHQRCYAAVQARYN